MQPDPFAPSPAFLAWLDSQSLDHVVAAPEAKPDTPRKRANGVPEPQQRTGQVPRWLAPPLPTRFIRQEGTLR